jgi:hypothetical protein
VWSRNQFVSKETYNPIIFYDGLAEKVSATVARRWVILPILTQLLTQLLTLSIAHSPLSPKSRDAKAALTLSSPGR